MCADERDRIEAAARAMWQEQGILGGQNLDDDRWMQLARASLAAADAVPAGGVEAEPQKWTGAEILRTGRPVGEAVNPPWNESVSVATGPTVVVQDTQTGSVSRPVQFAGHIDPDGREAWKQAAEAEAEAGDEARAEVARLRGAAEELAAALAELLDAVPGPGDRYVREQTASGRSGRHKAAFAAARDVLARFRAGGGED